MTMTEMTQAFVNLGFHTDKKYLNTKHTSQYEFTIEKDGLAYTNYLTYPSCVGVMEKDRLQKAFIEETVNGWEARYYCVRDLETTETITATASAILIKCGNSFEINRVIFNEPATIVFWADGTKTVVKCQDGDEFDPEKGLTMAIAKKVFGNKGSYCNEIKKWVDPYYEKNGTGITFNFDTSGFAKAAEAIGRLSDAFRVSGPIDKIETCGDQTDEMLYGCDN